MFENKIASTGIHYSRYIASWVNVGGHLGQGEVWHGKFKPWLRTLGLTEDEISDICNMATNGKLELEDRARTYLNSETCSEK